MPEYTPNYNLKKPLGSEYYNIQDHNDNMDLIDQAMKQNSDSINAMFNLDESGALQGYYKVTAFDTPAVGNITETLYKTADNSIFATRTTEFDQPIAGNIRVTLTCTAKGINSVTVTEFNQPTAGQIKETTT